MALSLILPIAREILDSEFQRVSRQNDVLLKAFSPERGDFLVLNELQLRYKNTMPLRMRAYTGLAEEKFNLPVYPVLINLLQPAPSVIVSNRFETNFLGIQARQDYMVWFPTPKSRPLDLGNHSPFSKVH